MPIRPENKDRYPKNWKTEIRPRILGRACDSRGIPCCEECGVPNYAIGYRDAKDKWWPCMPSDVGDVMEVGPDGTEYRAVKIVLTIAHLSDEIEDCSDENLRAWCQRCHNRYDAPARRRGIQERAHAAKAVSDLFESEPAT